MFAHADRTGIAPSSLAVKELFVDERDRDVQAIALPRAEVHVVARFGVAANGGIDVHVMGGRQRAHRKTLRRGQRAVSARLHIGATTAVLGAPAPALAGHILALEDLWGAAATRRLLDRLAGARDTFEAAVILERALAERDTRDAHDAELAVAAAERLAHATVGAVASDLGVSERHLRRVFRETVGVSPKTFAKLARFDRAIRAARDGRHTGWASIAADAGYYDQAHLIAEFRAIAGVTPRALLRELAL